MRQFHTNRAKFFSGQEHERKNPLHHTFRMIVDHVPPLRAETINDRPSAFQTMNSIPLHLASITETSTAIPK
jgi:hypothetical protein